MITVREPVVGAALEVSERIRIDRLRNLPTPRLPDENTARQMRSQGLSDRR